MANTTNELEITSGGESMTISEIMQRFRNDGSCDYLIQEALAAFALSRAPQAQQAVALHCSCGAVVTPEEYEEHRLRGHDAGQQAGQVSPTVGVSQDNQTPDARLDLNALRLHIVSEHANAVGLELDEVDALEYHDNEHRGPCTIRNHDSNSFHWSPASVAEVLAEMVEEEREPSNELQAVYRQGLEDAAKVNCIFCQHPDFPKARLSFGEWVHGFEGKTGVVCQSKNIRKLIPSSGEQEKSK